MTFESYDSRLDAALRRFVDTNLVGVLFTDLSGNITGADDGFLSSVGYTRDALPGSLRALTSPEHHRLDDEALEKLVAFGACAPYEKDLVRPDGSLMPVLFAAALHDDEIACFIVDLSQQKQARDKLNH